MKYDRDITPEMVDAARTVLGLGEGATISEIRSVYRVLWQQLHPDRGGKKGENEKLAELKRAYDIIMKFCENYEISFYSGNVKNAKKEYNYLMRIYDGWLGDLKKKKDAV